MTERLPPSAFRRQVTAAMGGGTNREPRGPGGSAAARSPRRFFAHLQSSVLSGVVTGGVGGGVQKYPKVSYVIALRLLSQERQCGRRRDELECVDAVGARRDGLPARRRHPGPAKTRCIDSKCNCINASFIALYVCVIYSKRAAVEDRGILVGPYVFVFLLPVR